MKEKMDSLKSQNREYIKVSTDLLLIKPYFTSPGSETV